MQVRIGCNVQEVKLIQVTHSWNPVFGEFCVAVVANPVLVFREQSRGNVSNSRLQEFLVGVLWVCAGLWENCSIWSDLAVKPYPSAANTRKYRSLSDTISEKSDSLYLGSSRLLSRRERETLWGVA